MLEPLKWYWKLNFVYKRTPAAFVRVSLCEKKACFFIYTMEGLCKLFF